MCVAGWLCAQKPEEISSLDHLVPIPLKQGFPESVAEKFSCLWILTVLICSLFHACWDVNAGQHNYGASSLSHCVISPVPHCCF